MSNYIDAFVFPIPKIHLAKYKMVSEQVAAIWKEYGALAYFEFQGDDLQLDGTKSFIDAMEIQEDEAVIFGWMVFDTKETRDLANKNVPLDERMSALVNPLMNPDRMIFDAQRMVYGGFKSFVSVQ